MISSAEQKLTDIIITYSGKNNLKEINDNTNLILDLEYDSINLIQMIIEIEKEFNIEFEDEDFILEKISNYSVLKKSILRKLSTSII